MKPLIVKLVGRGLPKDPGPWSGPREGKEFSKWYRKFRKLTDFIQSIFLPFDKTVGEMRPPEDIEVKLGELKMTYIGQHTLRTLHNSLTIPNVSYEWKREFNYYVMLILGSGVLFFKERKPKRRGSLVERRKTWEISCVLHK